MRPDSLAAVVFAIFIKEHIPSSAGWRRFAVINGVGLPRFGFVNDHEAAAAEISGPRKRYRQSEPDRNGRVDRIATLSKNLYTNARCDRFLRGNHAVFRKNRLKDRFLPLLRRRNADDRQDAHGTEYSHDGPPD